MSALLFCILLELKVCMVLHDIPKPQSKCRDFGHVAYMDDTTYFLDQVTDIQQLLLNLYQTGLMTHLHTSTVKLLVAVTRRQGLQVIFDKPDILAGGGTTPMADGKMYIRLAIRFSHQLLHKNDECIPQSQYSIEIHQVTSKLPHFDVHCISGWGAQMAGGDQTPVTRINVSVRSPSSIRTPCPSQLGSCPISIVFAAFGGWMDRHTTHYNSHVAIAFTQLYQARRSYKPSGQEFGPAEPVASSIEL